jgi:hypothetical protein
METNGISPNLIVFALTLVLVTLFIIAISQRWSLLPPPKDRNFNPVLSDWARQKGLVFAPQNAHVISGIYNNRWFSIGTSNEEKSLRIRMRLNNPHRTHLQIFGDWLEDSGVISFVNRFRVYSTPAGLSEKLFDTDTYLRDSLLRFPGLRARLDLFSDPTDPHHLQYSLLTDLPGAETLETILAAMHRFCDAFEQQIAQEQL